MLTVEILEEALAALRRLGIEPRIEWLGGSGGGPCEFAGRKWLFLDLAQTPGEQLDRALACLCDHPAIKTLALSPQLSRLVLPQGKAGGADATNKPLSIVTEAQGDRPPRRAVKLNLRKSA